MHATGSTSGLAALGSDGAGIVVVNRASKILFKNRLAESVLASSGDLTANHQTFASGISTVGSRLRAAIQTASRAPDAASPQLLHLPRASGLPLLGLIVPLPANVAEDLGALLVFWASEVQPVLPIPMLRQLFGLTPAEALTALATYGGQTPAEIAGSRRRSVATVRTLLSRVFMKCGVKRQAELIRLLARLSNACSFADGIRTGMDIQQSMQATCQPMQSHDLQAAVRIKDFAPGESTTPHYHTHGHEVVCVLQGDLTTHFGPGKVKLTPSGQALYIGENVLHRGHNPSARDNVQVLVINVTQRGKSARVDAPAAFALYEDIDEAE